MNAKRIPLPGKRRTNDGVKPFLKKSVKTKLWINRKACRSAIGDDHWKIQILVFDKNGVPLGSLPVGPKPPRPPITPEVFGSWIGDAINTSRPGR